MVGSVYERVLGSQIDELAPSLRRYVGMPPDGMVGRGAGTYDMAGSRHRWLRPVLWWLGWRHVLFAEYGREIPFTVVNSPDAAGTLSARRSFTFPGVTRLMEDTMQIVDGRLHDRLGRRRGLEVELLLDVVDAGLTMVSRRQWLHLGTVRLPLPPVMRVTLTERAVPPTPTGHIQRVDVRMTAPLLGEVFCYTGTFSYSYVPAIPHAH